MAPPSLHRVPREGSPASSVRLQRSDSLTPIPRHFVSFVQRYRPCGRRRPGLPGSWGAPSRTCPALRPRWDRNVRPFGLTLLFGAAVLPSAVSTASAPTTNSFRGSITRPARSLSTLRGHGHPCAAYDHARLATGWWPTLAGRDFNPLSSYMRFRFILSTSHPPHPGLSWRTET